MSCKTVSQHTTIIYCDAKDCTEHLIFPHDKQEAIKASKSFGWDCCDDSRGPMSSGWEWYLCPKHKRGQ